jgi:hypothetical protein
MQTLQGERAAELGHDGLQLTADDKIGDAVKGRLVAIDDDEPRSQAFRLGHQPRHRIDFQRRAQHDQEIALGDLFEAWSKSGVSSSPKSTTSGFSKL